MADGRPGASSPMPAELPGSEPTQQQLEQQKQEQLQRPQQQEQPQDERPQSPERFIAVGIDFGTTFSGVSWAYSRRPETIHEVRQWPCLGHSDRERNEVQVPSQMDLASKSWGYLVPHAAAPVRWFKLLLLRPDDVKAEVRDSAYLSDARKQVGRLGDDGIIDLVAEYLSHLWAYSLRQMEREMAAADLARLPFQVALTVPAIFPQYARNMLREAARRAGILQLRDVGATTLVLVEEPEAAALATLLERNQYPEMEVGETFIICDCGGGTVDIISYKVAQLRPFILQEAVKGDGKLCGSFLIDDAFEHHMQVRSGLKFSRCDAPASAFRAFVAEEWEYRAKRAFSGDDSDEECYLRPPARAFSTLSRIRGAADRYPLAKATVTDFFAETCAGVVELIDDQRRRIARREGRPPKNILLVGGLGGSRYLYSQLQARYGNVVQPQRAWSAVARGAVVKLLRSSCAAESAPASRQHQLLLGLPEVSTRIARLSYGVESGIPVRHARPPVDWTVDRTTVNLDGTQVVWRMRWFLRQGETIDNKAPVSYTYFEYRADAAVTRTAFRILTSDQPTPPVRRDGSVRSLCTIRCDYDTPFDDLPEADVGGGAKRVDGMVLTMSFDGEPQWHLRVGRNTAERPINVRFV